MLTDKLVSCIKGPILNSTVVDSVFPPQIIKNGDTRILSPLFAAFHGFDLRLRKKITDALSLGPKTRWFQGAEHLAVGVAIKLGKATSALCDITKR